ncbi:MAG TPA: hypothetical protein DCL00_04810 [Opitutae bacterium]|nr:hypothetical protein [Opitutae bacterium]
MKQLFSLSCIFLFSTGPILGSINLRQEIETLSTLTQVPQTYLQKEVRNLITPKPFISMPFPMKGKVPAPMRG